MNSADITFRFKQFAVTDKRCGMKIGTDGVLAGALFDIERDMACKVADVGAGCGIIALMIAQRFPHARIEAIESDKGAVADLCDNIASSPWGGRIVPIQSDFLLVEGTYDAIVSNPPYFLNGEAAPDTSRAMARHAGTLSPASLVDFATERLTEGGTLSMIVPSDIADDVEDYALFKRLWLKRRVDIVTSARRGITRAFLEFTNTMPGQVCRTVLDTSSDTYRKLTQDFYLKF